MYRLTEWMNDSPMKLRRWFQNAWLSIRLFDWLIGCFQREEVQLFVCLNWILRWRKWVCLSSWWLMMRSTRSDLNFFGMLKCRMSYGTLSRWVGITCEGEGDILYICVSPHLDETTYFLLEPKLEAVYPAVQQHCLALVKTFRWAPCNGPLMTFYRLIQQ